MLNSDVLSEKNLFSVKGYFMGDIYNKDGEIDYTICQKCGADRWPSTVNCPVCGAKYIEKKSSGSAGYSVPGYGSGSKTGSSSGNGFSTATTNSITHAGSAKYNKKSETFENGNMYSSPYERGVYDKKPEAKSNYGGTGIPFGLIFKLILIVALIVSLIVIAIRLISPYVDEQKEKELENQKYYQELIDETKGIVDENNKAAEELQNSY